MEKEFGERALNGDKTLLSGLKAQIADLERQLEQKQAAEKSNAKDEPKEDAGSEHETDSDVSPIMICYSFTHPRPLFLG